MQIDSQIVAGLIGGVITLVVGIAGITVKASIASRTGSENSNGNGKISWKDLHGWCDSKQSPILERLRDGDDKVDRLAESFTALRVTIQERLSDRHRIDLIREALKEASK